MNHSFQITPDCTCANRYLLSPGYTCEICMGIAPQPAPACEETRFDVDYFEALEEEYINREWAA